MANKSQWFLSTEVTFSSSESFLPNKEVRMAGNFLSSTNCQALQSALSDRPIVRSPRELPRGIRRKKYDRYSSTAVLQEKGKVGLGKRARQRANELFFCLVACTGTSIPASLLFKGRPSPTMAAFACFCMFPPSPQAPVGSFPSKVLFGRQSQGS
mmetsp:Transcript_19561/g.39619  ORF Transcript_19561/g.39619 Transcript_19561/m.39619 type:complete len:155 (-) Transcript_19561:3601-4065(-)